MVLDELTITPVRVPDDVNAPEAADFRDAAEVRNRVGAATRGADSVDVTPEQMLPHWKTADEEVHGWVIRTRGALAGRALMYVPLEQGSRRAQVRVELLPEFWGRGYRTPRARLPRGSGRTSGAATSFRAGRSTRLPTATASMRARGSDRFRWTGRRG